MWMDDNPNALMKSVITKKERDSMIRVSVSKDCGNSPKNLFIQRMTIAIAEGDSQYLTGVVSDDICWTRVGQKSARGKAEFMEMLLNTGTRVIELFVAHAFSHGKAGTSDGTMTLSDGSTTSYCHIFEFTGAKDTRVREITTFEIIN
jgi:hypothetical protein